MMEQEAWHPQRSLPELSVNILSSPRTLHPCICWPQFTWSACKLHGICIVIVACAQVGILGVKLVIASTVLQAMVEVHGGLEVVRCRCGSAMAAGSWCVAMLVPGPERGYGTCGR